MGFTNAGLGVGGGSGNASVGGLLRQAGSDDHGIHISHNKGDLSWHMQVESRGAAEAEVRAHIDIPGGTGNNLRWTFPGAARWTSYPPEEVNQFAFHEATTDGRGTASLLLAREGSPNHNGRLLVKYPTSGLHVGTVEAIKRPAQDNGSNSYFDVRNPSGRRLFRLASNLKLAGNQYWLRFRSVGTSNRLSFARQNDGNQKGFRVSYSTDGTAGSRTVAQLVDSFNRLISPTGVNLTATVLDGSGDQVVDFDDLASSLAESPDGGFDYRLRFGRTGIGVPRIADLNLSNGLRLYVARTSASTNLPEMVFEHASATADGTVSAAGDSNTLLVTLNGNVSDYAIRDAINNVNGYECSFSDAMTNYEAFTYTSSYTRVARYFGGGAANNNTADSITWSNNTLRIYVDASYTVQSAIAAIQALSAFDNNSASVDNNALLTDTFFRASEADNTRRSASFAGGAEVPAVEYWPAGFFGAHPRIRITYNPGVTTLAQMKTAILGGQVHPAFGHDGRDIIEADFTETGSQTASIPSGNPVANNPTGGRNAVPEGLNELLARPEDETDGPNILVKYDVDDDIDTIIEHFDQNNNGGFTLTKIWGTDGTANPESPTPSFSRDFYSRPPTVRATGPTDGLTQDEVDARVRSLAKGYALKSGGQVPDSDIPADIARDSEIPDPYTESLFSDAAPSASDNDQIPFFDVAGNRRKAASSVWRAKFKGWVGSWGDTPGFFVFRVGDLTIHNGQVYVVTTENTKNLNAGPDTNGAFQLIHAWAGTWRTGWYKAGSMVRHSGGLYVNVSNVVNTDGNPPSSTKWMRVDTPGSVLSGGPSFSGGELSFTDLNGSTHTVTIPTGGTNVVANPAGSDGGILSRLAIGGVNYIVGSGAEAQVGMARILGRVTHDLGKYPSDLADATDPVYVPPPVSKWEDPDVAADLARIEASEDWPVVPLLNMPSDGGFLSSLDGTENSVRIAEGTYVLGMLCENIWVGRFSSTKATYNAATATDVGPGANTGNARLCVVGIIEYEENGDWVEMARTTTPYIRAAPHSLLDRGDGSPYTTTGIGENPGDVEADGTSPAYDGAKSWVETALYSALSIPPGGLKIRIRLARGNDMADYSMGSVDRSLINGFDWETGRANLASNYGNKQYVPWGYFADVSNISFFPLGRPTQTQPVTVHPYVSSFLNTSGNIDPVAGSIAALTYGYSYRIAQSGRVGAARIIGFKGSTKPRGTTVTLATLTDFDHGVGTVTIPDDTSLAADEKYRIRLQVFETGVTPTADTTPISYQDIVITAHAAAGANYHWGLIIVDADDADAAATAARVVFTDDDITTGTTLAASYSATPPSAGTDRYQFYLAVRDGNTEPTGWNSGGLNADAAFQTPVTRTISGTDWKFWVLTSAIARASADGAITYEPRTS